MKILPFIGSQIEAQKFWKEFRKLSGVKEDYDKPDVIVVAGGDGTILDAQRLFYEMNVPIVGVGFGSVNFLLNRKIGSPKQLYQKLQDNNWEKFIATGMRAEIVTKDGLQKGVAFNDIYLKSMNPAGVVWLELNADHFDNEQVRGDGLLIATPQGSTAYNRIAGGLILPINEDLWNLKGLYVRNEINTPILHQKVDIRVVRGDTICVTDNKIFENVSSVTIMPSHHSVTILFDHDENFELRRFIE